MSEGAVLDVDELDALTEPVQQIRGGNATDLCPVGVNLEDDPGVEVVGEDLQCRGSVNTVLGLPPMIVVADRQSVVRADLRDLVQAGRRLGDVVLGGPEFAVDVRVDDRGDTDLLGRSEDDGDVLAYEACMGRWRDEADGRQQLAVLVGEIDEAEQLDVPVTEVGDVTEGSGKIARQSVPHRVQLDRELGLRHVRLLVE